MDAGNCVWNPCVVLDCLKCDVADTHQNTSSIVGSSRSVAYAAKGASWLTDHHLCSTLTLAVLLFPRAAAPIPPAYRPCRRCLFP